MDFLLWRAKDWEVTEEQLEVFPWIVWYNWKARNDKVFNNKDTQPTETLALALSESLAWKVAQVMEVQEDSEESDHEESEEIQEIMGAVKCQIDASWNGKDMVSGLGFVLNGEVNLFGSKGTNKFLSALHAELGALIWAMESALHHGESSVHFETDCLSILKIMDEVEEWPIFSTELDIFVSLRDQFSVFSIAYIPRNNNVCADRLARCARARGLVFSHVSSQVPEWLAHETNLFESV